MNYSLHPEALGTSGTLPLFIANKLAQVCLNLSWQSSNNQSNGFYYTLHLVRGGVDADDEGT